MSKVAWLLSSPVLLVSSVQAVASESAIQAAISSRPKE